MMDNDEYPQTAELEKRCVHMLSDLWNAPDAANAVGASAIGSPDEMLKRVDDNTKLVVPTFGVTCTGAYEPVKELAEALDGLPAETGVDVGDIPDFQVNSSRPAGQIVAFTRHPVPVPMTKAESGGFNHL
jgi:glutamate/tyrosine decarboxylase-like PLP-dependent enzyme